MTRANIRVAFPGSAHDLKRPLLSSLSRRWDLFEIPCHLLTNDDLKMNSGGGQERRDTEAG